jgi:hypothetical protein
MATLTPLDVVSQLDAMKASLLGGLESSDETTRKAAVYSELVGLLEGFGSGRVSCAGLAARLDQIKDFVATGRRVDDQPPQEPAPVESP